MALVFKSKYRGAHSLGQGSRVAKVTAEAHPDVVFNATYAASTTLNAGSDGTTAPTASSGATISGGYLSFAGGVGAHVAYNIDNLAELAGTGTIEFTVRPNSDWNQSQQSYRFIDTNFDSATPYTDTLLLQFMGSGSGNENKLLFNFSTSAGVDTAVFSSVAYPTLSANTDYVIKITFTSGAIKFYLDGAQVGTTRTNTYTADFSQGARVRIGNSYNLGGGINPDFKLKNFKIYKAVI